MMQVLYGLVLLLLVLAVVVLYAMFGELASRVPEPEEADQNVWAYERARIGAAPAHWPEPIAEFVSRRGGDVVELLVLSSSCQSCNAVAGQLVAEKRRNPAAELDVFPIVSCSSRDRGDDFVAKHGLHALEHYIDEGGEWVTGNFGVTLSPCALLIKDGALAKALAFQDFAALQEAVHAHPTGQEDPWESPSTHLPEAEFSRGEASSA